MKRPLAYITAPWGDNRRENEENAARYCRQVYDAGYSPICPMLMHSLFLKDSIPQEHKDGLDMAKDYLRRSHVLVVCGNAVTEAMNPDMDVPPTEKPRPGNRLQLNTNPSIYSKNQITDESITHSFFPSEPAPATDGMADGQEMRAKIHRQIERGNYDNTFKTLA